MKTGIPTNGSMVKKPHLIKNGIRIICNTETSFLLWFQACQVRPLDLHQLLKDTYETGESFFIIFFIFIFFSDSHFDRSGQSDDETQANETPKTNKKETTIKRGSPLCSDDPEIPEWLQEFRENLVDDEIPLQGGSHASSSHEASLEPTTKRREDLGKHNVRTHFRKDRHCEICKRTKITRSPCRRRKGEAVPRADNLVT